MEQKNVNHLKKKLFELRFPKKNVLADFISRVIFLHFFLQLCRKIENNKVHGTMDCMIIESPQDG